MGCVDCDILVRGHRYHAASSECFLKTKTGPVKGTSCATNHCWYHGVVGSHPKLMDLSLRQAKAAFGLTVRGWAQQPRTLLHTPVAHFNSLHA